jgi:amino acid transporter
LSQPRRALACSLAEETKNPPRAIPQEIIFAGAFTYISRWLFNIILVFCMSDPKELLSSHISQPIALLFYNVIGPPGAIFFTVVAFLFMNSVYMTAQLAGSRMSSPSLGTSVLVRFAACDPIGVRERWENVKLLYG